MRMRLQVFGMLLERYCRNMELETGRTGSSFASHFVGLEGLEFILIPLAA